MPKTQAPQVIDRSGTRPLDTVLSYGTGLEAILCLLILNGDAQFDNFERGVDIARASKRGLPQSVVRASSRLRTPHGDAWSSLAATIAADDEASHDIAGVLERLERKAPADLKATMLGVDRAAGHREEARIYRAVAAGDKAALASFRRLSAEQHRQDEVEPLLRLTATELRELVINALRDLPADLYAGPGVSELLERDALEVSRQLLDSRGIEAVVERLTRGLMYKPEPGVTGVVLAPSVVHRPWTLVLDHGRSKVFFYPCRLDAELTAPDLGLIAIYRALGDGTRLRILRRLATGPASVAQMSDQLGLAKSTVHEHLLSLRTAGLVRLPPSGGFELVPELPDLNWMLKEFLGLEMRSHCEACGTELEPEGVAYICSYECTFCEACAAKNGNVCPNCAGELVQRPRRLKNSRGRPRSTRGQTTATGRGIG
jgi:biotin operon repressor